MQDASTPGSEANGPNKATLITSAVLIAVLAGGIGMQLARVQEGKAGEIVDPDGTISASRHGLDEPVSRVNGESITFEVLAKECVERHGREVLENVINRTLIQQACAQQGVAVSDHEVETEIVRISKKFGLPVDQWQKMLQTERGLTPLQYRRDVIWPMLALKKLAGQQVRPTNEQMQQAYVDNYGPRVKARMMVLDNLRRANEVWTKVKAAPADDFEAFARDYSVEPNSRALGGTIPPIRRYSGADEKIREAAFRFKPGRDEGTVSGIIQVSAREYVILQFLGRTEPIEHDPKDVEGELYEEILEKQVQVLVAETFRGLKDGARIDNYLTSETHNPIQQTAGVVNSEELPVFDLE